MISVEQFSDEEKENSGQDNNSIRSHENNVSVTSQQFDLGKSFKNTYTST